MGVADESTESLKRRAAELKNQIATADLKQYTAKIWLNSLYGALGCEYFRYYDTRQAEAVTLTGQVVIRWLEAGVNTMLNKTLETTDRKYVVYVDTDSLYIKLDLLVKKALPEADAQKVTNFVDKVATKVISPEITRKCAELAKYFNCPNPVMEMKREAICDKAIWLGKKHYVLNIWDLEGLRFQTPKVKIIGLAAIQSSTPKMSRDMQKKAIQCILSGTQDELRAFVLEYRAKFMAMTPKDVAFPRGVNGIGDYVVKGHSGDTYRKGTPIHVKGSIIYNSRVKELKLTKKYELIQSGDKIRFLYLKLPNKLGSPVVAFKGGLPPEFELEGRIDYETQFEKTFLAPVTELLDVVGWSMEDKPSLDSLFC